MKASFFLVVGDVSGLLHDFGHEDDVLGGIARFETGEMGRELVAQHHYEARRALRTRRM